MSLTHPRCAPQLANQGHPGAADRVLLSPACGPATGGLAIAGGARTIRADVARSMGQTAWRLKRAGWIRPAAARGSTFLTLVLALMLAAAVFAVVIVLGLAAVLVVPVAVAAVVIRLG